MLGKHMCWKKEKSVRKWIVGVHGRFDLNRWAGFGYKVEGGLYETFRKNTEIKNWDSETKYDQRWGRGKSIK